MVSALARQAGEMAACAAQRAAQPGVLDLIKRTLQ
jgi:hypothetical protein